jgi:anti-sigma B factor antagonist
MESDFSIEINRDHDTPIIRVWGELDVHSCPQLNKALAELLKTESKLLVLNLDGVQYMDSTGLGAIAHAAKTVASTQGSIRLVCTKPQIKKIFEISGLSSKNVIMVENEELAIRVPT